MHEAKVKEKEQTSNTEISVNDEITFKIGWDMVPHSLMNEVKDKLMIVCGWGTNATFHNKRRGSTPITIAERNAIESIFAEYGIDAWTGQRV